MTRFVNYLRHNVLALLALFIALGGTSYAAFRLPAGSVGTRQLKNGAVSASKLKNGAVTPAKLNAAAAGAASVRAWAELRWVGTWQVASSTHDVQIITNSFGEILVWKHTGFANNCMASATPTENFPPGDLSPSPGYVTTQFFSGSTSARLEISGFAPNGTPQPQSVNVFILCPTDFSKKATR